MTLSRKSLAATAIASIALLGAPVATLAASSPAGARHASKPAVRHSIDRSRDRSGSTDRRDTSNDSKSSADRSGSGSGSLDSSNSVDHSGSSLDSSS